MLVLIIILILLLFAWVYVLGYVSEAQHNEIKEEIDELKKMVGEDNA